MFHRPALLIPETPGIPPEDRMMRHRYTRRSKTATVYHDVIDGSARLLTVCGYEVGNTWTISTVPPERARHCTRCVGVSR